MKKYTLFLFFFFLFFFSNSQAEDTQTVNVQVTLNDSDWNYKLGDKVEFQTVVTANENIVSNVQISYELSQDMLPPFKIGKPILYNGKYLIDAETLDKAGFLRCKVIAVYEGKKYYGYATAGFSPENITPTTQMPKDFIDFWDKAKAEIANVSLDPVLKLLPERCTDKLNVYELNIRINSDDARLYGILCVPKKAGKYPAFLCVPGAGVRPYSGYVAKANEGNITLEVGIHGIPVTMDKSIYVNLWNGALKEYASRGWDDVKTVYYKRVFLGCVKAVDYLYNMPEFDGKNLLVVGGSQGGALSIVTAALDKRVSALIAFYPALCDLGGYTKGRAGGWPHLFKNEDEPEAVRALEVKNTAYYDVVNFARILTQPGFYSFGYNDMVCPPTTTFSAYNSIASPKQLMIVPVTAHNAYPKQWTEAWKWWSEMKK